MTLDEQVERYDVPDSVILLEGKRKVRTEDQAGLSALGKVLAERTQHCRFRSGNAGGADDWFSKGAAAVDADRLEVITPYASHRAKQNLAGHSYAVEALLPLPAEIITHAEAHPGTRNQLTRYLAGHRDRYAIKAAYILRDTVKVLGCGGALPPARLGLFYDDLDAPRSGGTGHTMRVCEALGVPVVDQRVWMEWVASEVLGPLA